jgi:hypothetical protein
VHHETALKFPYPRDCFVQYTAPAPAHRWDRMSDPNCALCASISKWTGADRQLTYTNLGGLDRDINGDNAERWNESTCSTVSGDAGHWCQEQEVHQTGTHRPYTPQSQRSPSNKPLDPLYHYPQPRKKKLQRVEHSPPTSAWHPPSAAEMVLPRLNSMPIACK